MASVHLNFKPPNLDDLVKLIILESPAADGSFSVIEEVTVIGAFPDWISDYSSDQAISANDWFAIKWEDDKGVQTDISNPIQGGTESFVGEIVALTLERDNDLDKQTVIQEAEYAIEYYYGKNPYTVDSSTTNFKQRVGLARLVQARSMLNRMAQRSGGSAGGWTAGLVSLKGGSQQDDMKLVEWLLAQAQMGLGLTTARIAQMATIVIAGGLSAYEIGTAEAVLVEVE